MLRRFFAVVFCFYFVVPICAQSWIGKITPAETTLDYLQSLVGVKPKIIRDGYVKFPIKEGNLFVAFSMGKCIDTSFGRWDLESRVIIDVVYYPRKSRSPSFFDLKRDGMREGTDSGQKTFTDDIAGVYFATQFEKVVRIHYYPAKKHEGLRCKESAAIE